MMLRVKTKVAVLSMLTALAASLILVTTLYIFLDQSNFTYLNYMKCHLHLLMFFQFVILISALFVSRFRAAIQYASSREADQLARRKAMENQEEERKRISRELHDSIGQALYSIVVGLKILKTLKIENSIRNHVSEMEKIAGKAMEEVKLMALELRPSTLDDLGLVPAIRSFLDRYEFTFGIPTNFHLRGSMLRYSSGIETACYRIVQEALTNAAKYSESDHVDVHVTCLQHRLSLLIEDGGKGFLPEEKQDCPGLGLYSMKERAESVGGTFAIRSEPGKGTIIAVHVQADALPT